MSQCTTRNSIRAGTVDDNFTFLDNSGNSNPETWPPTHPPTPANMSTHFWIGTHRSNRWWHPSLQLTWAEATTAPRPNYGNQNLFDGSNSRKLRTFILQWKLNFRDHKDLFEDDTIRSIMSSHSWKGTGSRLFWICCLGSHWTPMASGFRSFPWGTWSQLWNLGSSWWRRSWTKRTSHAWKPPAMKYFIKFQQLAARVQWGDATLHCQAYNRLTKHIKDDMVHHEKLNTSLDSKNSSKLSMHDLFHKRWSSFAERP